MSVQDSAMAGDDDLVQKRKGRSYKRKLWTDKEDLAITNLVGVIGECNWGTIAERMYTEYGIPGRTGKQCRERWHNHLDPNVRKDPISPKEEELIFESHVKYGKKWAEIAKDLNRRTDNCIKNHFYSTLRRYTRRVNKFMGAEAFKVLTKYPGFKVSTDYLYKAMNDGKVTYKELKTVDTDQWQKYQKYYAKNLSDKEHKSALSDFISSIQKAVETRTSKLSKNNDDQTQLEDGGMSRRSSRLVTKKSKNYSEESENQNLYILVELINMDEKCFHIESKTRKRSRPSKASSRKANKSKQQKEPSSFGKAVRGKQDITKKKSSLISFKKANIETGKLDMESDDDKDSLDMNIGKLVKSQIQSNKRVAKDLDKQERSISFLQNQRALSKQSSVGRGIKPSNNGRMHTNSQFPFPGTSAVDMNFGVYSNRNSKILEQPSDFPNTRNKTKIYNFDNPRFFKEESDLAFKTNFLNEGNVFNTSDQYFSNLNNSHFRNSGRKNTSNVSGFNPFRDRSNPDMFSNCIPPLKAENMRQISNACSKSSSTPHMGNRNISKSFSQISGLGRRVEVVKHISMPVAVKKKVNDVSNTRRNVSTIVPKTSVTRRQSSRPMQLRNQLRKSSRSNPKGAFGKFSKA